MKEIRQKIAPEIEPNLESNEMMSCKVNFKWVFQFNSNLTLSGNVAESRF